MGAKTNGRQKWAPELMGQMSERAPKLMGAKTKWAPKLMGAKDGGWTGISC
jgi:hypothetical protein